MSRTLSALLFAALFVGLLQTSDAQATQDVTITVPDITVIGVDGGALTFNFSESDVTPGTATASISKTRSYSLWTNVAGGGVRITGKIDAAFNSGITLNVNLDAPSTGGTSQGSTQLSTSETALVSDVMPTAAQNVNINYVAQIDETAEPNSGTTQTVTYTVTAQ